MTRGRALLAVLALLPAACGEAPEPVAPAVLLAPVMVRDVVDRIEASGELRARSDARVAAEVVGRITGIALDEGDFAEAGAVVLEIDPHRRELDLDAARARLAEARATLHEAERDHARIRQLYARAAVSAARLDQAEATLLKARAGVDAAQAQVGVAARALRDAAVAAPFAGRIAERHVSIGEFVGVGAPLFRLVALDPLEVRFHVAERDSARVSLGDAVSVAVAPHPGERFPARVTMVSPTIDVATRTLPVKAEVDNAEGRLRPGLFARVDLGVDVREDVTMVPEEAILQRADGAVLFRMADGARVERRVVELGVFRDGLVEVTGDLAAGDHVVARGHAQLVDGAVVSPRTADGRAVPVPEGPGEATP